MNWLVYALLSSLSFGVQDTISYELLHVDKIGSAAVNTIVHCIFVFLGIGIAYITGSAKITKDIKTILSNYKLLITLAGICALIGNVMLYWAYQIGSNVNPGIITTISNGAVIVSTILAYLFFNKSVSLKQTLGIFVMLFAFTMGAMGNKLFGIKDKSKKSDKSDKSDKKKHDKKSNNHMWVLIAALSALSYGGLSFFQYMVTQKDKKLNMISLAITVALVEAVIGMLIYGLTHIPTLTNIEQGPFKNYKNDINKLFQLKYLPFTSSTALFDGAGLATLLKSYRIAPNPGFSDVISDSYSVIQSILTFFIYGEKMDITQALSIIVSILGITLISV